MCHCPSDGEYNNISHQTIKIQFATGQRGSLEVRKQREVTMKPGTQGQAGLGSRWGSWATGHWTLEGWGSREPASRRWQDQSKELGEISLGPTSDLSESTTLTFQPLSRLSLQPHFASLQCHWAKAKPEGRGRVPRPLFQGQASSLGAFFSVHTT